MTEAEMKKWIDEASYEDLLRRWRTEPSGTPFFQGEMGDYYAKVMARKRHEVGHAEAVRASKAIGHDW